MRLKTLLLALLPAATAVAQPTAQTPTSGQTYYIYNIGGAGYLSAADNTLKLSGNGIPVTISDADATAGTFYMDAPSGRISVTPFSGITTDGTGSYDQWQFTPVAGKERTYNISYRMKEGNTFPYLYIDATAPTADALKMLPYAPADTYTNGQWLFVAESDYADNTIVLDENTDSYSAPSGSNLTVNLKRTFSPGCWNTFCVPFDIDAAQLRAAFGDDTQLISYTSCDGMVLHFSYTDKAEAGKPYFIFIGKDHETPADGYVFTGINRFVTEPQPVTYGSFTFNGCFSKITISEGSYVINDNTLYHTQDPMTIKGFRGYISSSDASSKLNGWTIDDTTDGINGITSDSDANGKIYTIDGQMMRDNATDTKGMPEGVYVVKGKKIVIK